MMCWCGRKLLVTFCRVSLWIWLCRSFFSSTSLASSSLSSSFSCLMIRSLSAGLLFYIQQSTAALTPRTLQKKIKKWNPFRLLNIPWFLWVLNPPLTTQCNISEVQTCIPSTKIYKSSQLSESRALSSNARFLTLVSHHEQVRVQLFKVAEPVHRWTRGVIIWQNDDVIIFRGWRALLSFYTPGQKNKTKQKC